MRLLLDTHIVVWAALDPDALTAVERQHLARVGTQPVLSAVVVWELRLKWHSLHVSGARKGVIGPASVLSFAAAMDWHLLPLTAHHAAAVLDHPLDHKDPFDEVLLAQAQVEGLRLLTRDSKLIGHPLAVADKDR